MKKIAMIGQKNIVDRSGGVEVVVRKLCEELVKKNYQVTTYNRKSKSTEKLTQINNIKMKYVPTLNSKGLAAVTSSFFATIQALLFDDNDIFHYHAEGPAAMAWIPKIFGKKVVVTIHGLDHQRDKWGKMGRAYIKFGEKIAVKFADDIIVLSKNVQNYFEKKYDKKTNFIPNGIEEVNKKEVAIIKKWNLEKNDYILFLGRIVPEKCVEELILAYKKIRTDKKLIIAGASSDTNDYYKKVKNMQNDNIIFTGFADGEVLQELYSNAYIYVLPSKLEGMPMSLLEAMAYGNCCLVSDIPECSSVIGNYGIEFKTGDSNDLSEKLQFLCDNKEKVTWYKSNATSYILKKFNWDKVIDKTISLYERGM